MFVAISLSFDGFNGRELDKDGCKLLTEMFSCCWRQISASLASKSSLGKKERKIAFLLLVLTETAKIKEEENVDANDVNTEIKLERKKVIK